MCPRRPVVADVGHFIATVLARVLVSPHATIFLTSGLKCDICGMLLGKSLF